MINLFQKTVLHTYSILSSILSLIVLPLIFILRLIQGKDVSSWFIKLGKFELPDGFDKNKKTIMIHGVSVGEVVSLEKLIRKTKETFPDCNLILTTGTKTGQETAHKKMDNVADFITYFPIDIPFAVNKFLNKIKPDMVLIAETEIWPVFAFNCYLKKIPLFIINGRMSDESYKSYSALKLFFKCILPLYNGIYVQSEIDKQRLLNVGAPKDNLAVMKNLKFDIKRQEVSIDLQKGDSKVLIAGSTHKGEDEIVLETYKKLKAKDSTLKLLLAPRHITRTEDVFNLIKNEGLNCNLFSKNPSFKDIDVLLLDVTGELAKLYSVSDVAFIGGSFNTTGGHNPLEAIIYNKPVISGPSIKNFRDIYSILENNNAGFVVKTKEEFFNLADKLFSDENYYKNTVNNCESVFNNQQGALEFVINKIKGTIYEK